MLYITTAERIGIEKGEKIGVEKGEKIGVEKGEKIGVEKGVKKGVKKGVLIGGILMTQRILRQPVYSQAELETKSLKELKRILVETEARLPSS